MLVEGVLTEGGVLMEGGVLCGGGRGSDQEGGGVLTCTPFSLLPYFAVSFQLLFQPFKVSVASSDRGFLYLEYGNIGLQT